jgi:uncharacterized protein YjiS (DUF1127 family)
MNTLSHTLPLAQLGAGLSRIATGIGHAASALLAQWQHARKVRQTQKYLAEMDDHMLADLGVSRAQAGFEADRASRWFAKR